MLKIILAFYALSASLGLISVKLGAQHGGLPISYVGDRLHFNISLLNMTGIALYGLSFLLYTYLISKYDLGYIIPLATALVYIIIFFASYLVFKESFTPVKIAGILLIVIGSILLNLKNNPPTVTDNVKDASVTTKAQG